MEERTELPENAAGRPPPAPSKLFRRSRRRIYRATGCRLCRDFIDPGPTGPQFAPAPLARRARPARALKVAVMYSDHTCKPALPPTACFSCLLRELSLRAVRSLARLYLPRRASKSCQLAARTLLPRSGRAGAGPTPCRFGAVGRYLAVARALNIDSRSDCQRARRLACSQACSPAEHSEHSSPRLFICMRCTRAGRRQTQGREGGRPYTLPYSAFIAAPPPAAHRRLPLPATYRLPFPRPTNRSHALTRQHPRLE